MQVSMKELLAGNQYGTMHNGACCATEQMLVRSESMDIVIKRMSVHVDDKEKPQEPIRIREQFVLKE